MIWNFLLPPSALFKMAKKAATSEAKTILGQSSALILTEYKIKNLGTPDLSLQNKTFPDHQGQNATNLHKSNLWRNDAA